MRRSSRDQFWIVLAAAAVFFTNLGGTRLWDMDETLYSSIAREMLRRGDWVVPMFNGQLFTEKPPLMFWTILGGFKLFGINEFGARCGAALFGIGTALVTYHLGRRLFCARVGFWAGLIMASTTLFTVSARAATVDAALVFFTTLAMLLLVLGGMGRPPESGEAGGTRRPSWILWALFYACLGVTVLGKGPVGLLLPTAALGLFLLVSGCPRITLEFGNRHPERSEGSSVNFEEILRCAQDDKRKDREVILEQPRSNAPTAREQSRPEGDGPNVVARQSEPCPSGEPGGRWRHWVGLLRPFTPRNILRTIWQMRPLTALLVVLVMAGPWYALVGIRSHGDWLRGFIANFNFRPFMQPIQGHRGPFFYHLLAILIGFFPWSVFLVPALVASVRRVRSRHAWRPGYLLLACWAGVVVTFWSLCSTKLPHYVLPAFPPLALMTACLIDGWLAAPDPMWRGSFRTAAIMLAVVGVAIMIVVPIATAIVLPGEAALGLIGGILVAGGGACWFYVERGRLPAAMNVFAVAAVAFLIGTFGVAAMGVDRHQDAPALIAQIRRQASGSPQWASYRFFRESMVYYSGQHVSRCEQPGELRQFVDQSPHPYIFTTDEHVAELEECFRGELYVAARQPRFLHRGQLLVLARRADYPPPLAADTMTAGRRQ